MKQGLGWLLGDMDRDGNMFPGGYGIMEVLGLNAELIDVAVYTQQALESTARVAGLLGEPDARRAIARLASELKTRINSVSGSRRRSPTPTSSGPGHRRRVPRWERGSSSGSRARTSSRRETGS